MIRSHQDATSAGVGVLTPLAILRGFGTACRYVVYVGLVVLRVPVQLVRRLLVLPLVAAAVAWGFLAGWNSPAVLWLGGAGAAIFVFAFVFDTLILWVAPEGLHLDV